MEGVARRKHRAKTCEFARAVQRRLVTWGCRKVVLHALAAEALVLANSEGAENCAERRTLVALRRHQPPPTPIPLLSTPHTRNSRELLLLRSQLPNNSKHGAR